MIGIPDNSTIESVSKLSLSVVAVIGLVVVVWLGINSQQGVFDALSKQQQSHDAEMQRIAAKWAVAAERQADAEERQATAMEALVSLEHLDTSKTQSIVDLLRAIELGVGGC